MVAPNSKFEIQIGQSDKTVAFGLIAIEGWTQHFETMDYAIMCCPDSTLQIYEKGVAVGPFSKSYTADDLLSINIEHVDQIPIVKYYSNEEQLYQSLITPKLPMRGAICMLEEGAGVKASRVFGYWVT